MLTVILGTFGSGRMTAAQRLARTRPGTVIVSADGWIQRHPEESSAQVRNGLLDFIACRRDDGVIMVDVWDPELLLALLLPGDHVLVLRGSCPRENAQQTTGLQACIAQRAWLEQRGVTWTTTDVFFVTLPQPLAVFCDSSWLYDHDGVHRKPVLGHLLTLECYPGEPVTCCFRGLSGGTFHDLPLEAFCTAEERSHEIAWISGGFCYTKTPENGGAHLDLSPEDAVCQVFGRDLRWKGTGRSLGILHWPQDNQLLHLVELHARLLLWPPHKLLFTEDTEAELPDWKKLHPPSQAQGQAELAEGEIHRLREEVARLMENLAEARTELTAKEPVSLIVFPSPVLRLILLGGGGLPPAWGPLLRQNRLDTSSHPWDPIRGTARTENPCALAAIWFFPLDASSPWRARLAEVAAWMVWQTVPVAAVVSETEGYVWIEMIDRRDGWLTKTCAMAWRASDGAPYGGRWGDVYLSSLPTYLAAHPPAVALLLALHDVPEIQTRIEGLFDHA